MYFTSFPVHTHTHTPRPLYTLLMFSMKNIFTENNTDPYYVQGTFNSFSFSLLFYLTNRKCCLQHQK